MVVGEIFLASFLRVLFEKLMSKELLHFARHEGVHKELEKWSTTLKMIQAVLSDAEQKQLMSKAVKLWLDDLRDLAYDVEDIMDKLLAELLRHKIESLHQASSSEVWNSIFTCLASSGNLMFDIDLVVKEITRRLQDISERKDSLGLNDIVGSVMEWERPPSSSLLEGPVIGRDEDKKLIIEMLLRDQQSSLNFDVVGIVGMAGVGKTTLAGLVFNDYAMKYFDIKVWVSVSVDSDYVRLTKAILKSVNKSESDADEEISKLQEHLIKVLRGKKFLIVLDDVWNTKDDLHDLWLAMQPTFGVGAPGSKIIVTTREVHVAKAMVAVQHYNLQCVSDDDCWKVFVQHAFCKRNSNEMPKLESLREKIIGKCNGLPLAAATLGGLLHCKEINEWEDILNDKLWILSDQSNILPLLRLSYHYLPSHLKRCFAYCSIFPKGYEFEEKQLVLLWMAEGLVQQPEGSKQIEDLGREYFHELLSRSFFQKTRKDESKYVMHYLMNDLAEWVGGAIYFRLEDKPDGDDECRAFEKTRHSSYMKAGLDGIQRLGIFSKFKHLRTFLPLAHSYKYGSSYLSNNVSFHVLPKLKCLRVLSLKGYCIVSLPDSIGELKLLRYLDLSYTNIMSLPESICSISNLQTLLLECCHDLHELPIGMKNLTNLRHLNNSKHLLLKGMPPDLGKLTNLQTLPSFVAGKESGFSGVGELGPLWHLRGPLTIFGLENVNGAEDAAMANLAGKNGIDILQLNWSKGEIADLNILEMLQPPRMLKELTIKRYGGSKFPTWMGNPSFCNMVLIRLEDCKGCRFLPPLGQLVSLKELTIERMSGVERIGIEFYGEGCLKPFPSLETLSFDNMENWRDWFPVETNNVIEVFSQLKELIVKRCQKLTGKLPYAPSLSKLVVDNCVELVVSIPRNQMLCELDIKNCKEVVCENEAEIKSQRFISISPAAKFQNQAEGFMQGLTRLKHLTVCCCKGMSFLWCDELRQLTCLHNLTIDDSALQHPTTAAEKTRQVELRLPTKLETLELRKCDNLVKVPEGLHLALLQELHIYDCPSLTSFPESGLPSSLRVLKIEHCKNLVSLVQEEYNFCAANSLESLVIINCPCLKSISSATGKLQARFEHLSISACGTLQSLSCGKLPDNLRKLEILNCRSLICLSSEGKLPETLEHLEIWSCSRLKSLSSEGRLPKSLKILLMYSCLELMSITDRFYSNNCLESVCLYHCKNLRSLPEGLHHLINLKRLHMERCENLVSFPEGGLPTSNLRVIYLECNNIVYPRGMQNLIFLQRLSICYGEGFMRVIQEDGFPPNLTSLTIWNLRVSKPLLQWGLHRLTSLRELDLNGVATDVVSFPPEPEQEEHVQEEEWRMRMRMMFPESLITLSISNFENLDKLSAGIRCLTSLQNLSICYCEKLNSLPQEGLPLSLLKVEIVSCPLLEEQCTRNEGQFWPLIAHIPCVEYDYYQV